MAEQEQLVESLVHQCYHYIAMNLEKFPVSYLSLLPLKVREELLWRLPIADMCLLEDTEYVEGFQDMAAYWKLPCKYFQEDLLNYTDVAHYVEEWDSIKYAKAILYGQVAAIAVFGHVHSTDCGFCFPFDHVLVPFNGGMVIPLLYAVRKPQFIGKNSWCDLTFPPRYRDKGSITSKKDIINTVRSWFKCRFPKIMLQVCIPSWHEDVIDSESFDLINEVADPLINEVALLATSKYMLRMKQVVQRSSCLEVIILDGWFFWEISEFLNFLSTQDGFLSRFRLLVITQYESTCTIVRQSVLGPLITAYFSAPTTHPQKISITGAIIIQFYDTTPVIDQRYVQFKTIEFNDCHLFDGMQTSRFSHKAITDWLGEDIIMLHKDEEENVYSLTFKVREKAPGRPNGKRRHSDIIDSENSQ
jgi:hypothetical protein